MSKDTFKDMSTNAISNEKYQSYLEFARQSVVDKSFTNNNTSGKKTNKTKLKKALTDPITNYNVLQDASRYLCATNGIYSRLVSYFSSLLTYDHFIYPLELNTKSKNKLMKEYDKSALLLHKMNLKYNLAWFTKEIMTVGEVFLYKLEDSTGIVYKLIPSNMCRISDIENGVYRYEIDMTKLDDKKILTYPLEFKRLYNNYKNGENKERWKQISNKGVAFPTVLNQLHSFPPMSYLLPDIMEIDEIKSLKKDSNKLDNTKIIHNKVPIDKETGLPVMDLELAKNYNKAMQDKLPDGMVAITNPFDSTPINLSGSQAKINNIVEEATDYIFSSSGVSDMLFANKKSSSEALKKSIMTDIQMLYATILPLYINYINYELNNIVFETKFNILLLETTYFTRNDDVKISIEEMNVGGSRLKFLALCGLTPLQAVNLRKFEENIALDDYLMPKLNGHVISGKDDTSKSGRPSAETQDEITDNAEKSIEQR